MFIEHRAESWRWSSMALTSHYYYLLSFQENTMISIFLLPYHRGQSCWISVEYRAESFTHLPCTLFNHFYYLELGVPLWIRYHYHIEPWTPIFTACSLSSVCSNIVLSHICSFPLPYYHVILYLFEHRADSCAHLPSTLFNRRDMLATVSIRISYIFIKHESIWSSAVLDLVEHRAESCLFLSLPQYH